MGPGRCSAALRVVSKPGQAPPPPTGTAARPSGPSGALHTCGAGSLFGSSTRRLEAQPGPYWDPVPRPHPSRPALTSHISEPTRNFARNSPMSLSNSEIRSLELQRFPTLLKLLLIELRATFPVTSPRHSPVPQPSPTSAKKFALLASISVHTRKSSPCSPPSPSTREKVRPAHAKHPKISLFSPAGRTFSQFGPESTPAGRVFSRR